MRSGDGKLNARQHVKLACRNKRNRRDGPPDFGMTGKLRYQGMDNLETMMRCSGIWKLHGKEWMHLITLSPTEYAGAMRSLLVPPDFRQELVVVNIATPLFQNRNRYGMMTAWSSGRDRYLPPSLTFLQNHP